MVADSVIGYNNRAIEKLFPGGTYVIVNCKKENLAKSLNYWTKV